MVHHETADQTFAEQTLNSNDYHECLEFDKVYFDSLMLESHSFEDCIFISCSFNHVSLKETSFISCTFEACSFTLCEMKHTTLNGAAFLRCRIIGLKFTDCSSFAFSPEFRESILDSNMFFENNLHKCIIEGCTIRNTDFIHCNLKEASFKGSVFDTVLFEKTNLEKSVFLEAKNYTIDPFGNKLKGAVFDLPEAQSFLGYLGIRFDQ
ncbi:MAG: pentapeptide repeat-containing protein [Spirochaetales bacterium]|nr:pentapeptide repeat-containing protein [Spirochaetales bacterium]